MGPLASGTGRQYSSRVNEKDGYVDRVLSSHLVQSTQLDKRSCGGALCALAEKKKYAYKLWCSKCRLLWIMIRT